MRLQTPVAESVYVSSEKASGDGGSGSWSKNGRRRSGLSAPKETASWGLVEGSEMPPGPWKVVFYRLRAVAPFLQVEVDFDVC